MCLEGREGPADGTGRQEMRLTLLRGARGVEVRSSGTATASTDGYEVGLLRRIEASEAAESWLRGVLDIFVLARDLCWAARQLAVL